MSANKPPFDGEWVRLNQLCMKGRSALRQKDLIDDGPYAVYGASGIIGSMSTFQNSARYVAVVKDGAGVGRVNLCSARTSVLGTMQALIPTEMVLPEYLLHLIRAMRLGDGFSGSTIPHIYFKDYGQRLVRYVSMADQERIVGTLGSIEDQIDILHQQKERLDTLVKSRFVEMFGDAETIEAKWDVCALRDCVESLESGKSPSCQNMPRKGLEPGVLKLSALSSGRFLPEENKAMLPGGAIAPDKGVRRGDILIARKNTPELVGSCVLVRDDVENLMFPDIVFRMHPNGSVEGEYLSALLSGPSYSGKVKSLAHGSNKSMSNIPKADLAQLRIPLPSLPLQQEFASFVAEVDKSRFIVQQKIEKLQTLYDSLAQEYFG